MAVPVPQPVLDHAVINVADQLDNASARFRRLGFQLTERGHQSLGSSNHLAIFGENYLELLGYEPGKGSQRADQWNSPLGLSGLVWKSSDAESEFLHLERQDLDGDPPAAFWRPVTLPDGSVSEAHFRLGYEPGKGSQRADQWNSPLGLSGLVWKSSDAESEFLHLERQDLDGDPPAAFWRPVTLPDGSVSEAHFRTVRLRASLIPNGRSFFCQHLTPDTVWQPAWQRHHNGVQNISEFVIVAQDPAHAAQVYSRLFGAAKVLACPEGAFVLRAGAATVRFASADYAQQRFGPLPEDYDGSARMVALGFATTDLALVKNALLAGNILFHEQAEAIVVACGEGFNLALRFA
ncbi:VOC family protein [Pantoea sp. M_5]|uniref:VOC family protein n=1 Tax=Pantoea sp. M_5 TaxID=2608038 RepID=UPI001CC1FE46|nr:VOC family protein [Pantoea sp. M_5]